MVIKQILWTYSTKLKDFKYHNQSHTRIGGNLPWNLTPGSVIHPPPPIQKVLFRTALSGRRGRYAHAYGICAPFYCISLKKIKGGGITLPIVWFQGIYTEDISEASSLPHKSVLPLGHIRQEVGQNTLSLIRY